MPWKASPSWLLGVLALLAIGALAWHLASVPPSGPFDWFKGVTVGDVDIGELAAGAVNGTHSSLQSIKDEGTARAALPGLQIAAAQLDRLTGLLGQMGPYSRNGFTEAFASIKPNLDQLLDKTLAIPGVRGRIKPVVDKIRSKLDTLATA